MRLSLSFLALLTACGAGLPPPPDAKHPIVAYLEVPYPPPAALAETIPAKPRAEAVWLDGEWLFHGEKYVWKRGGWFITPKGSGFAPWHAFYRKDGRMLLASGTWYDGKGTPLAEPSALVPAETPANQITPETQTGR